MSAYDCAIVSWARGWHDDRRPFVGPTQEDYQLWLQSPYALRFDNGHTALDEAQPHRGTEATNADLAQGNSASEILTNHCLVYTDGDKITAYKMRVEQGKSIREIGLALGRKEHALHKLLHHHAWYKNGVPRSKHFRPQGPPPPGYVPSTRGNTIDSADVLRDRSDAVSPSSIASEDTMMDGESAISVSNMTESDENEHLVAEAIGAANVLLQMSQGDSQGVVEFTEMELGATAALMSMRSVE